MQQSSLKEVSLLNSGDAQKCNCPTEVPHLFIEDASLNNYHHCHFKYHTDHNVYTLTDLSDNKVPSQSIN